MTAEPRITIVTPSFNQARFLEQTIRSVLEQGYGNLEYMVVDGGSTDGSRQIIEKYADRLAWWCSEPDGGQTDAINKGLRRATGQVMAYLNSDDLLMPGALRRISRAFANPRVRAVCGWRVLINERGEPIDLYAYPQPTLKVLMRRAILPQETIFWRREVWERVGEFNADFRFTMDLDYWLRMTEHGVVPKLIPRFIGVFRVHELQKSQAIEHVGRAEGQTVYRRYHGPEADADVLRKKLPYWWYRKLRLYRKLVRHGLLKAPPIGI